MKSDGGLACCGMLKMIFPYSFCVLCVCFCMCVCLVLCVHVYVCMKIACSIIKYFSITKCIKNCVFAKESALIILRMTERITSKYLVR